MRQKVWPVLREEQGARARAERSAEYDEEELVERPSDTRQAWVGSGATRCPRSMGMQVEGVTRWIMQAQEPAEPALTRHTDWVEHEVHGTDPNVGWKYWSTKRQPAPVSWHS